jgi:F0F1-type ATP synthase assembly protein I
MGMGWYGVGVKDESRPEPRPEPLVEPKPKAPRSAPFFSSVDASMLGLGSQMLSEVIAGVLIGYGLDYLLGTKNTWIVVGSLAGVTVAMVSVIRVAMRPQSPRRPSTATGGRDTRKQGGGDRDRGSETGGQP